MTQMTVGYRLQNIETSQIIQSWGGVWGQCPGVPNPIVLPNGDQICAPVLGTNYQGFALVEWTMTEPAPQQAPMWAVRTVLQINNLFDQAQTAINASSDIALKNIWEYGNYADRNSPAINSLGQQLGLTSAQMDDLFRQANAIIV